MTISERSRVVLKSVNWFWPAYMKRGYVMEVIAKLESEPAGPQRTAVFETCLAAMYTPGHLAAMLLDRYRFVPMVSLFQRQIGEAIEAACLGLCHAAVALLIPIIEGIVREHATQAQRNLGSANTARLTAEIQAMVAIEREKYPGCSASDERITMIEMFGVFLTESLYMDTWHFTGDRELNRHGALHGRYRAYGNKANFYVLISIIDLLSFILSFRTSGISVLAPDMTLKARRLGLYYLTLRDLSGTLAAVSGARQ